MSIRPFLKFLFFHLPRLLFQVAGIVRAINRGKRHFRKGLESEGLPEEFVGELVRAFDPLESFGLREILSFSRGGKRGRG